MARTEAARSQRALPRVLIFITVLLIAARITWTVMAPPEQPDGLDQLDSEMRQIR